MQIGPWKLKGFLFTEGILYASFLALDITGLLRELPDWGWRLSGSLKYLSVTACFFWQLGRKDKSLAMAQAFVLAADFFLLFTGYDAVGICGFLGVQMCYRMYLCGAKSWRGYLWQCALLFAGAAALLRAWGISGTGAGITDILALVYGGMLAYHLLLSLKKSRESSRARREGGNSLNGLWQGWAFSLALFLLLLCDMHVALCNLPLLSAPTLAAWQKWASVAMWFFYLPSQVLAAVCALGGHFKETGN